MKISKQRVMALKKRAARAGRSAIGGSKSTVYEGAAGAVAAYAGAILDDKVQMAADKPWLKGAALIAAGHFAKKKKSLSSVGAALCGAGGYALGLYLKNRNAAASAAPAAAAPSQTSGVYDSRGDWADNDTGIVFTSAAAA